MKDEMKFLTRRNFHSHPKSRNDVVPFKKKVGKRDDIDALKRDKTIYCSWDRRSSCNSHVFVRWLDVQVGRNWDSAYSDAAFQFKSLKHELQEWVQWRVAQNVVLMDDGHLWNMTNFPSRICSGEYYVDEGRILRKYPVAPRRKRRSGDVDKNWKKKRQDNWNKSEQAIVDWFNRYRGVPGEPIGYCKKHFLLHEFFVSQSTKTYDWVLIPKRNWRLAVRVIAAKLKYVRIFRRNANAIR